MLGKSLAAVAMPDLQKAVMGMDPRIKPFEALAELQTRVKREKMQQAMQAQNPQQPPVAQQAMAEAAALRNPYMAGLASAPVESPVGMAGGGIVAFEEGGEVPGFAEGVYVAPQMFNQLPAGSFGASQIGAVENQPWAQRKMDELAAKVRAGTATPQERAWISMFGGDALNRVSARESQATYQKAPDQLGGETARLNSLAKPVEPKDVAEKITKDEGKAGLAAATPRGAGGAGAGARVGLGATSYFDESKLKPMTDDERIASVQKYKQAMGAQNEEFLRPLQERLGKYESEIAEGKKGAMADALVQAGLGMMAGKSQYALQNIGEGGAAGLAALRESKKLDRAAQEKLLAAQGDMAKSRIALEKGDEATAVALANQGRQEQQAAAQYDMLGKYYAGSNAAQMAAANAAMARAGGAGGADKQRLNELKALQATLQKQLDPKQNPMLILQKNAAEKASLQSQLAQVNAAIAQMAGLDTITPQVPQPPGAGGNLPPLSSFYNK